MLAFHTSTIRIAVVLGTLLSLLQGQEVPSGRYLSPSARHRVLFKPGDPRWEAWVSNGAVEKSIIYESFILAVVDETRLGGRAALLASGVDLRDEEARIAFNGSPLDTASPECAAECLAAIPAELRAGTMTGGRPQEEDLWIVQFAGPVKDEWLARLEMENIRVVSYVSGNGYVVKIRGGAATLDADLRFQPHIQWVGPYHPWFRLAPELRDIAGSAGGYAAVVIQMIADESAVPLIQQLSLSGIREDAPSSLAKPYLNVRVTVPHAILPMIAAHPSVFAIEPASIPRRLDERQCQIVAGNLNAFGTSPSAPGYLSWLAARGFAPAGQFAFAVDVTDDGIDLGVANVANPEFRVGGTAAGASRLAYNNNFTSDPVADGGGGHGNINASIAGGFSSGVGAAVEDVLGYNYGLGVCPFVGLGNTKVFDNNGSPDFLQGTAVRLRQAFNGGARISSNSWGNPFSNRYDVTAQEHDLAVRDADPATALNQELTIVFAAGNSGRSGARTVLSPSTAKNVIAVGASENARPEGVDGCGFGPADADDARDIACFSSRGPSFDGRARPDIVAPGTHIQGAASRSPNFLGGGVCDRFFPPAQINYCWSSGTSHAAPAVAGGAALVRQWFLNQGWGAPSPAMVKASLMGTARYLRGFGANDTLWSNNQGTGMMDLGRAFDSVARDRTDQSQVFGTTGQSFTRTGWIQSSAEPFRVALVWTDAMGPTVGNPLVNNLDLEVIVAGMSYRGNVFAGPASTIGGAADLLNNAEFVFLPPGTTGAYSVTVRATNIAGDGVPGNADATDQDFALLIYNGTAASTGSFQISAAPATLNLQSGSSAAISVSSSAVNGFPGNALVSLTASSAVIGLNFSFSQATIPASGFSTLTVSTTGTALIGTYTVSIVGVSGALVRSASLAVTVTPTITGPVFAPPGFSLAVSPSSRIVTRGTITAFQVSNSATGLWLANSQIALSVTPAIPGLISFLLPPAMGPGGGSNLFLTALGNCPTGTVYLTVTATSGTIVRSVQVMVAIQAAADPGFTMTASPPSRSVARGQSTNFNLANVFAGPGTSFTCSVTPPIAGVSYAVSPALMLTNGTGVLTVSTTTSAPVGTYPVTITAIAAGRVATALVTLNIELEPVRTFSIAPNLSIPDASLVGTTSSIIVPASQGQVITSVSVSVVITHPRTADLRLVLTAPDGTQVLLQGESGCGGANLSTTWPIVSLPDQSLAVVNGSGSSGTWRLNVSDRASFAAGVLNSWSLTFNGERSSTTAVGIPEGSLAGASSIISIPQSGTVSSVRVRVNINHPAAGQLVVRLIGPDGISVLLHSLSGGAVPNISAEYPELVVPAQSLSTFHGHPCGGDWRLQVMDLAPGLIGSITSWTLSLTTA